MQQVQASQSTFAAISDDGSVVAWGDVGAGGDIREVQDQLMHVHWAET